MKFRSFYCWSCQPHCQTSWHSLALIEGALWGTNSKISLINTIHGHSAFWSCCFSVSLVVCKQLILGCTCLYRHTLLVCFVFYIGRDCSGVNHAREQVRPPPEGTQWMLESRFSLYWRAYLLLPPSKSMALGYIEPLSVTLISSVRQQTIPLPW